MVKIKKRNFERVELVNKELYPFVDIPGRRLDSTAASGCPTERQTFGATPLFKQLVGAQVDGVSLNNSSLLQRQYDDKFGQVDPASDIHTDVHLLQDALMKRAYQNKVEQLQSSDGE